MENSETKQRWINRPFVKGFLGGIVVLGACNFSQLFTDRFEMTADSSLYVLLLQIGIPLVILLGVGWIANRALGRFGFEGFKASEEWQFGAVPGCLAGGVVYMIVAAIIIVTLSRVP